VEVSPSPLSPPARGGESVSKTDTYEISYCTFFKKFYGSRVMGYLQTSQSTPRIGVVRPRRRLCHRATAKKKDLSA
jgi:hypothetical protein